MNISIEVSCLLYVRKICNKYLKYVEAELCTEYRSVGWSATGTLSVIFYG